MNLSNENLYKPLTSTSFDNPTDAILTLSKSGKSLMLHCINLTTGNIYQQNFVTDEIADNFFKRNPLKEVKSVDKELKKFVLQYIFGDE